MRIILLKPVEGLGNVYDIVNTKDGYARNFLFPRKLAIPATEANIKGLEKNKKRFSKTVERLRKVSMDIAERLNTTIVRTSIKTGLDGKSFGSITSQNLVELLGQEQIILDKKAIILDESIKRPGEYEVKVHLGEQIDAVFKVIVEAEGE